MATRFGGVSSGQKARQVKALLGFCVFLIVALVIALVVTFKSPSPEQVQPAVASNPTPVQTSSTVNILVSRQRVEKGAQLQAYMFEPRAYDVEDLPSGALLQKDLARVVNSQQFAGKLINANEPLLESSISGSRPITAIEIPPGHRAVTITVDARTGVEGFAKPNSRVDVLWTYKAPDGRRRVTTIVPFAKVLSVAGATNTEGNKARVQGKDTTTVTLLVTIQQAKKVELARTLGALTLSLVGEQETLVDEGQNAEVTLDDLLPRENVRQEEIPTDGVMYMTDPTTGKKIRYILVKGRWQRDE